MYVYTFCTVWYTLCMSDGAGCVHKMYVVGVYRLRSASFVHSQP